MQTPDDPLDTIKALFNTFDDAEDKAMSNTKTTVADAQAWDALRIQCEAVIGRLTKEMKKTKKQKR